MWGALLPARRHGCVVLGLRSYLLDGGIYGNAILYPRRAVMRIEPQSAHSNRSTLYSHPFLSAHARARTHTHTHQALQLREEQASGARVGQGAGVLGLQDDEDPDPYDFGDSLLALAEKDDEEEEHPAASSSGMSEGEGERERERGRERLGDGRGRGGGVGIVYSAMIIEEGVCKQTSNAHLTPPVFLCAFPAQHTKQRWRCQCTHSSWLV